MVGLEDDADWNDFETRTYLLSDALTEDERPVLRARVWHRGKSVVREIRMLRLRRRGLET